MIREFDLRFGPRVGAPVLSVPPAAVTIFVGPNNSGKSRLLQELSQYLTTGQRNAAALLLGEVRFDGMSNEAAEAELDKYAVRPGQGENVHPGYTLFQIRGERFQMRREDLLRSLIQPHNDGQATYVFCHDYLGRHTLLLSGGNRTNLINQQRIGDLLAAGHGSLQILFRLDGKRREAREFLYDAFGSHFVIDPTEVGSLRIRYSSRAPIESAEERGIDHRAVEFHRAARPIDEFSDGVKAFTGIVIELIAGDPRILLIDEPDAFLHPALATKLGQFVGKLAHETHKYVIAATHSPFFVMGCIQSGAPTNIVRLTYRDGIATARLLSQERLVALMRNPLLRSTNLLSALFYEAVVVSEADTDRAFYQEANERLVRFDSARAAPNCLFANAQNKQTIPTIIRPLRELGIPAAAIVDIDFLKEGGQVWARLMESIFVPQLLREPLNQQRAAVKQALEATGRDMKREGGIQLLPGEERAAANEFFDQLQNHGLFVVRGGEVETWLHNLGATGHGPAWLIDVFERMGEDPAAPGYIRPGAGDVWDFLASIRSWIVDPARRGMPD